MGSVEGRAGIWYTIGVFAHAGLNQFSSGYMKWGDTLASICQHTQSSTEKRRNGYVKRFFSVCLTLMLALGLFTGALAEAAVEEATGLFTPGTYAGIAMGMNDNLFVQVTLSEDAIESITVTKHAETAGIADPALERIPQEIVDSQSLDVDTVAGATVTSNAIIEATRSALSEAGIDASTLQPVVRPEGPAAVTDEVVEVDIVVLGAGGAGMTAAIEAAHAGKSVLVVEKAAMTGGNTTRSTGGMNAAVTPYQAELAFEEGAGVEKMIADAKAGYGDALADLIATVEQQYADYAASPEGYFDSVELFMLDTLVGGKNVNNHALVETLASQSAGGIEWLSGIGAELTSVGSFGGASVKRIHRPVNAEGRTIAVGSYLVPILTENVQALNIQVLYETPATEIIMEDGVVTGAKAASSSVSYTISAKAVIVATGGFGANEEMYTSYRPDLAGFVTTNAPGITGDGIKMGEAIGAATVDMDQIQIHPTVEQSTSALITEGLRGDGAILVNANGERFVDEVGTRDVVSAAEVAQPGGFAWLVIDQAMADASSVIAGYIAQGLTVQGDTYEALAEAMEVDPDAFAQTMDTWNQCVAAKQDDAFSRTSFANALDTAPFYAIKIAPGVHHTMGGLKINENTEVLDAQDAPIPGLFAAGEVTGGVHGANRLGGNAVADIIVFGRIAGQNAAAYVGE